MIISATLNIISEQCLEYARTGDKKSNTEVFDFIKSKLEEDEITGVHSFEQFKGAFNKILFKSPNQDSFILSEIEAVKRMIAEALCGIPNAQKIYETIHKYVLINADQPRVFRQYFKKPTEQINFQIPVRAVYLYGLIKYLCFLEGGAFKSETPQSGTSKATILRAGMDTGAYHQWLFDELMKADNPELMLTELKAYYLSEKMAAIARQYRGERYRELNNLKLVNPRMKGEDFGMKSQILKAEGIVKLFEARIQGKPPQFKSLEHLANEKGDKGEVESKCTKTEKRIPAKYYALYHWLLIEMGKEKEFEHNDDGQFKRHQIEAFATNRYKFKDGQPFYRAFISIDITKKTALARSFGKGYKEKIILLSDNDADVIAHLKEYPN